MEKRQAQEQLTYVADAWLRIDPMTVTPDDFVELRYITLDLLRNVNSWICEIKQMEHTIAAIERSQRQRWEHLNGGCN